MQQTVLITGYGPGLGEALKQQFEQHDYHVIGLSRTTEIAADLTDPASTQAAFEQVTTRYRAPDVVIHNVAELVRGEFNTLSADDFERAWRSSVLSAINVCHNAIPHMQKQQQGTIILTGATASARGGSGFAPFSSAKFALRGLAQSLAREFQSQGIHIIHTILDGIIWSDLSRQRFPSIEQENCLLPEDIAQVYYDLVQQKPSAWSQEIDLRPQSERF
jgi:NAD(P)-dependent dehydrogenase (short-subunit alcohol dehydrogenase family)